MESTSPVGRVLSLGNFNWFILADIAKLRAETEEGAAGSEERCEAWFEADRREERQNRKRRAGERSRVCAIWDLWEQGAEGAAGDSCRNNAATEDFSELPDCSDREHSL